MSVDNFIKTMSNQRISETLKHYGPGNHESGSSQEVHGNEKRHNIIPSDNNDGSFDLVTNGKFIDNFPTEKDALDYIESNIITNANTEGAKIIVDKKLRGLNVKSGDKIEVNGVLYKVLSNTGKANRLHVTEFVHPKDEE